MADRSARDTSSTDPGSPGKRMGYGSVPFLFGCAQAEALPGPVLVTLLQELGWTRSGARALLHRMTQYGLLDNERIGRIAQYRLAGMMRTRFEGYGQQGAPRSWDGRFHTVLHQVPEAHRRARDALLSAAHGHGYRQFRPGVLIAPWDHAEGFLDGFDTEDLVVGWLELDAAESRRVAARCWRLAETVAALDELAVRLRAAAERPAPPASADALRLLADTTGTAITTVITEDVLPPELLPLDWPVARLHVAIDAVSAHLGPATLSHVRAVINSLGLAELVVAASVSPGSGR